MLIVQDAKTGHALPSDPNLTHMPSWESCCDGSVEYATQRHWRPFRNLVRRVRRHCRNYGVLLTTFKPHQQDIKDGCCFPSYSDYSARDGESMWVIIVLDPSCEENVIYAYGPALDIDRLKK